MIYISACCLPDRMNNHDSFIQFLYGLLRQKTNENYKIILNIPNNFINYKNSDIPDWVKNFVNNENSITILRDNIDYGPISNIIYPLKYLNLQNDDILIVCDDDHYYHEEMIQYHLLKLNQYPQNHSICFRGNQPLEMRTWYENGKKIGKLYNSCVLFPTPHDIYLKFPDHWHSVSYRAKNLDIDKLLDQSFLQLTWNNDLLMGYYGWKNNILYLCANYYKEMDYRPVNYDGRGSNSFPILQMLPYEYNSGCNLFRNENNKDVWSDTNFTNVLNTDKGIIEL